MVSGCKKLSKTETKSRRLRPKAKPRLKALVREQTQSQIKKLFEVGEHLLEIKNTCNCALSREIFDEMLHRLDRRKTVSRVQC